MLVLKTLNNLKCIRPFVTAKYVEFLGFSCPSIEPLLSLNKITVKHRKIFWSSEVNLYFFKYNLSSLKMIYGDILGLRETSVGGPSSILPRTIFSKVRVSHRHTLNPVQFYDPLCCPLYVLFQMLSWLHNISYCYGRK
jgi:hypothetical protein